MNYSNDSVRRQDRLLDKDGALRLLREGEYGILSMTDEDGKPYGIPMNYVWDGADSIYLHCAVEGKKLRCIAAKSQVSFCIVGKTQIVPSKFTTLRESVVIESVAQVGLDAKERFHALEMLLDKYCPNDKVVGLKYAEKSLDRTQIIKMSILSMSGKCKHSV